MRFGRTSSGRSSRVMVSALVLTQAVLLAAVGILSREIYRVVGRQQELRQYVEDRKTALGTYVGGTVDASVLIGESAGRQRSSPRKLVVAHSREAIAKCGDAPRWREIAGSNSATQELEIILVSTDSIEQLRTDSRELFGDAKVALHPTNSVALSAVLGVKALPSAFVLDGTSHLSAFVAGCLQTDNQAVLNSRLGSNPGSLTFMSSFNYGRVFKSSELTDSSSIQER